MTDPTLVVALAQMAPVFLDRDATLNKVVQATEKAGRDGARLVAFGETLVPGYPAWISHTDGARFDAPDQKRMHAMYLDQAVSLERGHLDDLRRAARRHQTAVVLGIVERPLDRGDHSVFCSRVYIEPTGEIGSVHRKLMPTYEERLSWSNGDGAGLVVHPLDGFRVGALNCWENWMPLARAALHAQGEDLHIALWPGTSLNTGDITRFMAREGRSYCLSVSGLLRGEDVPAHVPGKSEWAPDGAVLHNGGTAAAGPDGTWLLEPRTAEEGVHFLTLDPARVREERQNFDPSGHYARPDVLRLHVDRTRHVSATFSGAFAPPAGGPLEPGTE